MSVCNGNREYKTSICGLCGGKCAIEAEIENEHIMSVRKLTGHPYLSGDMCVKGAALKQYIYSENRLQHPMKRIDEDGRVSYREISWEQAISEIAQRLNKTKEESGPHATIFYAGHPKWFRKPLAELSAAYGTPNFVTESSTCHSATAIAYELVCGSSMIKPDMKNCDVCLIWSENLSGQKGEAAYITGLKSKGKKVIVVDPHKTGLSEHADLHLQLIPGTDGALAHGIAHVIISEGLEDRDYIERHTTGYEQYKEYIRQFTPEAVSKITGVPREDIVQAAHMIASGRTALKCSNCSMLHGVNGVQNLRSVMLLLALTGSIGVPGGMMPPGGGMASLDTFHHVLADRPDIDHDISDREFPVWNEIINNEGQCIRLADVILHEKPYKIRNFVAFGMNANMWPESHRILEALDKVEFSVVAELFWNEACERADYVLPACASPEMDHVVVGKGNHMLFIPRIIDPGDKLPDVEIMLRLARALGVHGDYIDHEDYDAYVNYTMRKTGVTLAELKAAPEGIDARTVPPARTFAPEQGFKTPSGKVEFVSGVLDRYKDLPGHDPLPVFADWRDMLKQRLPEGEKYDHILVVGPRKPFLFHSRTYRLSWLAGLERHTMISICSGDAEKLGVSEGDRVRLTTPKGSMEYTVEIDDGILPGVVYTYHDDPEQNANDLLDGSIVDPISGFPCYRSYVCRLDAVV